MAFDHDKWYQSYRSPATPPSFTPPPLPTQTPSNSRSDIWSYTWGLREPPPSPILSPPSSSSSPFPLKSDIWSYGWGHREPPPQIPPSPIWGYGLGQDLPSPPPAPTSSPVPLKSNIWSYGWGHRDPPQSSLSPPPASYGASPNSTLTSPTKPPWNSPAYESNWNHKEIVDLDREERFRAQEKWRADLMQIKEDMRRQREKIEEGIKASKQWGEKSRQSPRQLKAKKVDAMDSIENSHTLETSAIEVQAAIDSVEIQVQPDFTKTPTRSNLEAESWTMDDSTIEDPSQEMGEVDGEPQIGYGLSKVNSESLSASMIDVVIEKTTRNDGNYIESPVKVLSLIVLLETPSADHVFVKMPKQEFGISSGALEGQICMSDVLRLHPSRRNSDQCFSILGFGFSTLEESVVEMVRLEIILW